MKSFFLVTIVCLISSLAQAQHNRKPKIVGQDELATYEDESITILMTDLRVDDSDDWFYPWGFSMQLYAGDNYTFEGHTVTPTSNFSGKIKVKVTVNDGRDDSNKFDLEIDVITVNDKPVITGHSSLEIEAGLAFTIQPEHLEVEDPDNSYPQDFSLRILAGNNYTANGNQIMPQSGFTGTLMVNVMVNDGAVDSDVYSLPVAVRRIDPVPQITGQMTLQVNEDQSLNILLSHLLVSDGDSNYPQDFSLTISSGPNYKVSNATVSPDADYFGKLSVPVTVSDGKNTSKPFNLAITVTPVNDVPVITDLETGPLFFNATTQPVRISETLSVEEPDGDSIMFAEIAFQMESYQENVDRLIFAPDAKSKIRGVFDSSTGVLTLLGQASPASYSRAIRSVQYENLIPAAGLKKKVLIVVNDGKSDSEEVERDIAFGQAAVSLDIPTGFTPNGDQSNDTWKIIPLKTAEEFSNARVRVYNKSGIVVYESIGFQREWDGRLNGELLPADTYYYTIDLNINAPEGLLKGLVTILR
jgi:gliding motility-associated-like protein